MSTRSRKWVLWVGVAGLAIALVGATLCEEEVTDKENEIVVWHRKRIVPGFLSADPTGWHDESIGPYFLTRERIVERRWFIDGTRTKTEYWRSATNIPPPRSR